MNPEPKRSAAFYRVAVIIGVVGVLLRLAYCFESGDDPSLHHPIIDSFTYHSYARTIAEGGDPWNGVITRPPLYPYLLGAVYTVFGVNMTAARVLQAVLGGATCILTCLLGRRLFDDRVAWLAGAAVALYGPLIFLDQRLQATALVVFCFTLALLTATRAAARPVWYNWLICGLAVGLAALARPNIALFVPVLVTWTIAAAARRRQWRAAAGHTLALLGGCLVVISPITIRNYAVSRQFVPISCMGGINLHIGNNPQAQRTIAARPGPEWERLVRLPNANGKVTQAQADRYYVREVISYATSQPGDFLAGLARKARLCCSSIEVPRNFDIYSHRRYSKVLQLLVWRAGSFAFPFGVLAPLAVVGMVLSCRGHPIRLLPAGYILACALSVVLFFNASRYRVPIVPAMTLFAAWTVFWLAKQAVTHRPARLAGALAAVSVLAVAINLPVATPYDGINFQADLQYCLGFQLNREDDVSGAERAFRKALELAPDSALVHDALANLDARQSRYAEALPHARRAVELAPDLADLHVTLGRVLTDTGALDQAAEQLRLALDIEPAHAPAHESLADVLTLQGDPAGAAHHLRQAIRYQPAKTRYHRELAKACIAQEQYADAIAALENAQQYTDADSITILLAWLLATCPDQALRNCDRAVTLSTQIAGGRGEARAMHLDTLAAAYACAGRFDEAVHTTQQAAAAARRSGKETFAQAIDRRADLYRNHQPCTDPTR